MNTILYVSSLLRTPFFVLYWITGFYFLRFLFQASAIEYLCVEWLFQNHSLVLGHTKKNCDAKNWKFRKLSELERETRLVRDTAAKSWKLRAGPLAPPYRGQRSAASTRAAPTSWLKSYCRIFNKIEKNCRKIISQILIVIFLSNKSLDLSF